MTSDNQRFAQAEMAANKLLALAATADENGAYHIRACATAYEWLVFINRWMIRVVQKRTKNLSDLTWEAHFHSQLADNLHLIAMVYRVAYQRGIEL